MQNFFFVFWGIKKDISRILKQKKNVYLNPEKNKMDEKTEEQRKNAKKTVVEEKSDI